MVARRRRNRDRHRDRHHESDITSCSILGRRSAAAVKPPFECRINGDPQRSVDRHCSRSNRGRSCCRQCPVRVCSANAATVMLLTRSPSRTNHTPHTTHYTPPTSTAHCIPVTHIYIFTPHAMHRLSIADSFFRCAFHSFVASSIFYTPHLYTRTRTYTNDNDNRSKSLI